MILDTLIDNTINMLNILMQEKLSGKISTATLLSHASLKVKFLEDSIHFIEDEARKEKIRKVLHRYKQENNAAKTFIIS